MTLHHVRKEEGGMEGVGWGGNVGATAARGAAGAADVQQSVSVLKSCLAELEGKEESVVLLGS